MATLARSRWCSTRTILRQSRPDPGSLVLPQDRVILFLGGGSLLSRPRFLEIAALSSRSAVRRSSWSSPLTCRSSSCRSPRSKVLFRVREKIALRIKEAGCNPNPRAFRTIRVGRLARKGPVRAGIR